jgi:mxaJ protein
MSAAAALVLTLAAVSFAAPGPRPAPRELRVCADPNNLPFSNDRGEGFENRLAQLVGSDLGWRVRYTWWPQRRGFLRNTLEAGACDVVIGVPTSLDHLRVTRPYYRSTYVFVTRRGGVSVRSFDDAILRRVRVGVQMIGDDYANSPPAHALAARGIVNNVVGYTVYGDYAEPSPPSRIVRAVAAREVDVAVVWGPLAGFFAPRQPTALTLRPVSPQVDLPSLPFVFDIGMGVRRADQALLQTLEAVLARRRPQVDALLARFHVPRVDPPPRAGA